MHQDWNELYNIFKGPEWPECPPKEKFHTLPHWIQQELITVFGVDPYSNNLIDYEKFFCDGDKPITVLYTADLDGGGTTFGKDYVPVIKSKYPNKKFSKVFEWCSGPGFIGYNLLSHNLCDYLCFSDLSYQAIKMVELTSAYQNNNCDNYVSSYLIKDLALMPTKEMFDLVVANPPHFKNNVSFLSNTNRICSDHDWKSHQNFFQHIKLHLNKDGIILLQENKQGSQVEDFKTMIINAGLQITDYFDSAIDPYYYIEIRVA
jgi:16S rRNA G966 N2-methylase RsmD